MSTSDLEELSVELGKCSFCGFCEYKCPTYRVMRMRHYGPRGRIFIIKQVLNNPELINEKVFESIFTCITCHNCIDQCPNQIHITEIIIKFRKFLINKYLK